MRSILGLLKCSSRVNSIFFSIHKLPVTNATILNTTRSFHANSQCLKEIRSKGQKIKVGSAKFTEEQEGENTVNIRWGQQDLYPDEHTPNRLFNNIPYKELPIINIKATPNNTIMNLTDHRGLVQAIHSAGIEGYKNSKKGTNVAAQQAAISFSETCLDKGVRTVRIRVQGIGPGRTAAMKGLAMGGLSVVSITDDTRVSWNPPRPRKQRRI